MIIQATIIIMKNIHMRIYPFLLGNIFLRSAILPHQGQILRSICSYYYKTMSIVYKEVLELKYKFLFKE